MSRSLAVEIRDDLREIATARRARVIPSLPTQQPVAPRIAIREPRRGALHPLHEAGHVGPPTQLGDNVHVRGQHGEFQKRRMLGDGQPWQFLSQALRDSVIDETRAVAGLPGKELQVFVCHAGIIALAPRSE